MGIGLLGGGIESATDILCKNCLRSPCRCKDYNPTKDFEHTTSPLGKYQEKINHPEHYGGVDNPYEAIKVIEAWNLGFCLGNTLKYICRIGKKNKSPLEDLKKAQWYLTREIERLENSAKSSK